MRIILSTIGLILPFLLMYYREQVGNAVGESKWMRRYGGIYYMVVLFSLLLFFWAVAELTNTTEILFGGLRNILPGLQPAPQF